MKSLPTPDIRHLTSDIRLPTSVFSKRKSKNYLNIILVQSQLTAYSDQEEV